MNAAKIPADGVLVLQGLHSSGVDEDWLGKIVLTVTRDGQPFAGALEATPMHGVLVWRPEAPWEPGATYSLGGELTNGDLGGYVCAPATIPVMGDLEIDAAPGGAIAPVVFEGTVTPEIVPEVTLETLACCPGAAPLQLPGGCGTYFIDGAERCAPTKATGYMAVAFAGEPAAAGSVAGQVVYRLEVDGQVFAQQLTPTFDVYVSSSNVEDGLDFNGAGLYTSVSGCALDAGDGGASACDPDKHARPLDAAIKQVWASLWDFGAFEEREYYQIDHAATAMGLLVSLQYEDERANGVAFTGNPGDAKDGRYTINVQLGEVDVVSPPAGVTAELDRLTVKQGEVTAIERAAASSLVPPGQQVLSDAQLRELGGLLAAVAGDYPLDPGAHAAADVLLDVEFKYTQEGALKIKQIRRFLRGQTDPSQLECE